MKGGPLQIKEMVLADPFYTVVGNKLWLYAKTLSFLIIIFFYHTGVTSFGASCGSSIPG